MRPTLAPQLQEQEPEGQAVKSQQHQQREHQHERVCDYCNESTALLYCRADSAKLCFSCDREVHTANQLFSKHSRSLLCDRCDKSAASIFCETEHSVLCQNCDWESHNLSLSSVHNRRAIEGFTGCPSVTQLLTIVGFDDLGNKALFLNEEIDNNCELMESGLDQFPDFLLWETPAIVSLDDLIVASDSAHNFRAMDVPPLPKNRNAAYGQHKEEMLSQLRELAKSEPNLSYGNAETEPSFEFEPLVKEKNTEQPHTFIGSDHVGEQMPFPACETSGFQSLGYGGEALDQDFVPSLFKSYIEETSKVSDKQLDIRGSVSHANDDDDGESQHLIITNILPVFPKMAHHELNSQERETAISRYKEKKKTRRYDKHIRYESRKVRAESRTRIRGRFAKT